MTPREPAAAVARPLRRPAERIPPRLTAGVLRALRALHTVRLRLTLWYGGLFLASGAALLAITYALVIQAFAGNSTGNLACPVSRRAPGAGGLPAPGPGCHAIGAQAARAMALQQHAVVLHELWTRSAIALVFMAMLSIALGWFIAGRVLRPLRTITAAAREISASSLGKRLALSGPGDELKELGDTFDGLLTRLEASFTAQRRFIANASHELRTPLARQRVISQVALADPGATITSLRAAHERVLASGTQQQQLLDSLLSLAQGQAGPDKAEPFDLAVVTGRILATREPHARRRNLTLHARLDAAPALGSEGLAGCLVANLVDNALRHNVPGGQVEVITRTRESRAVVTVANTGSVIPDGAVGRLFQPFERLPAGRANHGEGFGLGLSIVQAIADSHGGSITACPRPGGGLLIEVAFSSAPTVPGARVLASGRARPTP